MPTVSAEYDLKLKITETLALAIGTTIVNPKVVRELVDTGTLDANSTIPVTDSWSGTVVLAGGSATLDLTALANGDLSNKNFAGLKIVGYKFKPVSGNTGPIEVAQGASNGYFIFGTTGDKVTLDVGDVEAAVRQHASLMPDIVNGSADQIDFTGTSTDSIEVILLAG